MKKMQFSERSFRLFASVTGNGSRKIIAFHGFGQDNSVFRIFHKITDHSYQLHSFDLPFHGKSSMPIRKGGLDKDQFRDFFLDYFQSTAISSFTLIGFSIGAKFALNLVHFFPERIDRLILIAPDGLKINFWYHMATNTWFSRHVFRYFMQHPVIFMKFADMLTVTRLIHPSVSRFAKSQMEDDRIRQLIYDSWVNYRTLNLDIRDMGKVIDRHRIPVEIFLGEKDRVISADAVKPLIREFHHVKVHMLPVGHTRLIEDTAEFYEREGF
ncbi:MAG: alpha/beta hydrolase [Cyclobacteriaceae bacterium]|nr:alpha/beta hydrolase [Cyclobacteriaceae bacterium]